MGEEKDPVKEQKATIMRWLGYMIGAAIVGLGLGLAIAMTILGQSQGATWAWWQIVLASLTATSGAATCIVTGLLIWVSMDY